MEPIVSRERFIHLMDQFTALDPILVVGDVGIDKYTYGEVKRISPEAPVPVLEVTKEWLKLGLAANISHNLKTLDVKSTLCGVVGNDNHASIFETLLEDENLHTWGLVRSSDRPTIFKERVTTNTQQICRIDYESTDEITKDTEQKLFSRLTEFGAKHSAIIIEDYAKGTLTKELLEKMIAHFKEQKKFMAVDPGRSTPPLYYKGVDLLKPNLSEAKTMVASLGYKDKDVAKMADILMDKLDLSKIIITLGAEGMAILDRAIHAPIKVIPTLATEVFDVSGAGDTAISLIVSSLMSGATLVEASFMANCGSGVVVGKKGTATVNKIEMLEFFDRLQQKWPSLN